MKIKHIVCPVDLSKNSFQAIGVATSLATANGAEIIFLHVAMPDLPIDAAYAMVEADASVRAADEELRKIKPTRDDVKFRHVLIRGEPAQEILRCAEDENADLIVMTTHGRTGFSRLLMGSVAEHVVRKARCPVLTFRSTPAKTTPEPKKRDDKVKAS